MALSTYAELQDSIAGWLNRDDLTARIPDFIRLCEVRMNKELRVREMLVRDVTSDPEADEAYENLPADFMELKMLRFNNDEGNPPEYATPTMIERLRRLYAGQTGVPLFYSIAGNQILFERIPSGVELEILSYVKIPALNGSTQTSNGILENYPDLYLYGSLMEAEPYLKNDPRLATWTSLYQNARDAANLASERAEMNPGPLVARPRRSF